MKTSLRSCIFILLLCFFEVNAKSQTRKTLWREDFNDLYNWIAGTGNASWGNQKYYEFTANHTKNGLERTGEYGQENIPLAKLRGILIDLAMPIYEFVIYEVNRANREFALDDRCYNGGQVGSPNPTPQQIVTAIAAFPNPVTTEEELSYKLKAARKGDIKAYYVCGQWVVYLLNGHIGAGQQKRNRDLKNRHQGICFIRLRTDRTDETIEYINEQDYSPSNI